MVTLKYAICTLTNSDYSRATDFHVPVKVLNITMAPGISIFAGKDLGTDKIIFTCK